MKVNSRELGTVLAALRFYQRWGGGNGRDGLVHPYRDIATNGDTLEALTVDEIDGLCERINCGPGDSKAEAAARQLLEAYALGEAAGDGGSVDWENVDHAFVLAKDALPGVYEAMVQELTNYAGGSAEIV